MNSTGDKSALEHAGRNSLSIAGYPIMGFPVDDESRCIHYHSPLDIVAIKFPCCNQFSPSHDQVSGHTASRWRQDRRDLKAVLCGAYGYELSIEEYLTAGEQCPSCKALFNPGCRNHHHLYFEP